MCLWVSQSAANCFAVDPHDARVQLPQFSVEQLRNAIVHNNDGTAQLRLPNGELRTFPAIQIKAPGTFELLTKQYRIEPTSPNKPPAASSGVRCKSAVTVNLGVYGSWVVGSYMEDPWFWHALQSNYLKRPPSSIDDCKRKLHACLQQAKDATELLYGWCGVAAGVGGIAVGSACLVGAFWAKGRAEDDCWRRYTTCTIGFGRHAVPESAYAERRLASTRFC